MNGKGSDRRKEDEKKVREELGKVNWNKRDKSKDSFSVKVNGTPVK
tara:strand:- start:6300 stop:6437 length:138 start_codon:yes stop_codon:yes gene_type:complete